MLAMAIPYQTTTESSIIELVKETPPSYIQQNFHEGPLLLVPKDSLENENAYVFNIRGSQGDCKIREKKPYFDRPIDKSLFITTTTQLPQTVDQDYRTKRSRWSELRNRYPVLFLCLNEMAFILFTYFLYEFSYFVAGRGHHKETALINAQGIVDFEKHIGLFFEPELQNIFLMVSSDWFVRLLNAFYMFAHLPCSVLFLVWAFVYHRGRDYYTMRNGFVIGHILTMFVEASFPAAPPRMLPEYGFVDTILIYTQTHLKSVEDRAGINPYAAMPSMHFQYAFLVGFWGVFFSSKRGWQMMFVVYTLSVFFAVIVTGNHFVLDCIVAVIILGVAHLIINNVSDAKRFVIQLRSHKHWLLYLLIPFGLFICLSFVVTNIL